MTILMVILALRGWSQQQSLPLPAIHSLEASLSPYLTAEQSKISKLATFREFMRKLERKRQNQPNDLLFTEWLFSYTHRTFLHTYREFANFNELFTDQQYNCLTASILFSKLLTHFQIPHELIETNYHIFIMARIAQTQVLMETTDGYGGFITNPQLINERVKKYRENALAKTDKNADYYEYGFSMFETVQPHELSGLLYYNLAVESYNQQQLVKAVEFLSKAAAQYSSPRIMEFSTILLLAVHESKLGIQDRSSLKKTLQTIRYHAMPAMASSASLGL